MLLILNVVLLVVGFVLLVKGADYFVDGSSSVAKKFNIPIFVIGLTVVAMGTSLPECAVSTAASIQGSNGMAIGNIVGSNIFNLMLICGVCALFTNLPIDKKTLTCEFPISIVVSALLIVFGGLGMKMGHIDGFIFIALFVAFLIFTVKRAMKFVAAGDVPPADEDIKILPNGKCALFIIGGAAAIVIGGELVVKSASYIAGEFGLSDNLIGLTICAFGTSLPELVTSVVAARKKQIDMALGNVIGSNIFNILLVGGIASAINPIALSQANLIDAVILLAMNLFVLLLVFRKQVIKRAGGLSMILIYAAYVAYICVRM